MVQSCCQFFKREQTILVLAYTYVGSSGGGPATSPSNPFTLGLTNTCCTVKIYNTFSKVHANLTISREFISLDSHPERGVS